MFSLYYSLSFFYFFPMAYEFIDLDLLEWVGYTGQYRSEKTAFSDSVNS